MNDLNEYLFPTDKDMIRYIYKDIKNCNFFIKNNKNKIDLYFNSR